MKNLFTSLFRSRAESENLSALAAQFRSVGADASNLTEAANAAMSAAEERGVAYQGEAARVAEECRADVRFVRASLATLDVNLRSLGSAGVRHEGRVIDHLRQHAVAYRASNAPHHLPVAHSQATAVAAPAPGRWR